MLKTEFYVCPICGNVIFSIGEIFASCHGITLIKEEATENEIDMELIEDEVYIKLNIPMTKIDYFSFVAGLYDDGELLKKWYPEQEPTCSLKRRGLRKIYFYNKREGLFCSNINMKK